MKEHWSPAVSTEQHRGFTATCTSVSAWPPLNTAHTHSQGIKECLRHETDTFTQRCIRLDFCFLLTNYMEIRIQDIAPVLDTIHQYFSFLDVVFLVVVSDCVRRV